MQLGRIVPMPLENDQQTTNYRASQSVGGAAEFEAIVRSLMGKNHTIMLGEVMAITQEASSTAAVGFLSVRPMVFMVDGSNNNYDRATINNVPFFRLQAGGNAVILNPKVGDIGLIAYCERDISMVKRNKKQAAPNSRRQFNINDAVYLGGMLNGAPTQYVQFTDDKIIVKATSEIILDAPQVTAMGKFTASGIIESLTDVIAKAISLFSHKHGGVQAGGSNTGEPE